MDYQGVHLEKSNCSVIQKQKEILKHSKINLEILNLKETLTH
jgi:hypothetical protein